MKLFRYEWIWEKNKTTGHLNSGVMSLQAHENILVFYKSPPTYNPQITSGHKPIELIEYLIKTYTNEGDTVLDNCGGSCVTAEAAVQTKRNYIVIEIDYHYATAGEKRVRNMQLTLF